MEPEPGAGPPVISVVVPTRDRAALLVRCLESLVRQRGDPARLEVIVVDDGSADDTAERVESSRAATAIAIHLVRQEHRGPAAARNRGLEAARGQVVAFIDDDCVAGEGWLKAIADAFADLTVTGVGGRLVGLPSSTFVGRYCNATAFFERPAMRDQEILYLNTANAAFRRDALLEIGGFDESFRRPGGEEVDLCRRLRQRGARLVEQDSMMVHYAYRDDLSGLLATYFVYGRGCRLVDRNARAQGGPRTVRRGVGSVVAGTLPGLFRELSSHWCRRRSVVLAVAYLALDVARVGAYRLGYVSEFVSERWSRRRRGEAETLERAAPTGAAPHPEREISTGGGSLS